ncbi:MAG TPA: hypothetical protein VM074_06460 [Solimonas sp.]|nr:hypothetical protein [Solimonas sp.]
MGVEVKLSDRELPVSPVFIDYLAHLVDGRPFTDREWHDQLSEKLNYAQRDLVQRAPKDAERVMADPRGRNAIARSYHWLLALLTGNQQALRELQLRYHFVNVVGIPRTGGSYLTQELYRALGLDPAKVHNALAHDGFPEAGPFQLNAGANSWIVSLQTMAEYLVMVELFFGNRARHSGKIVVPKKLTKGIYAGGFFHRVLGEAVENIVTLRHPVTTCISTYEKSGGLPADGRFALRSNIEEWCRRDLAYVGISGEQLQQMDYFDAYLRYWEQYHLYIATTGLSANRDLKVIVYGKERMEEQARSFHRRYESKAEITEFQVFEEQGARHPDWVRRAQPVLERVAAVWERVGLRFPLEQMMECW